MIEFSVDAPPKQANGSGNFSTFHFYTSSPNHLVKRTGERAATIYGPRENYNISNIDRIAFEDDYYDISAMPITPPGESAETIQGLLA